MTQQHPIIPPPELVQQWVSAFWGDGKPFLLGESDMDLSARAAQWGADQELEACCEWLEQKGFAFVDEIRAARRPKPPSLKEQALIVLDDANLDAAHENIIRRALEQLDD